MSWFPFFGSDDDEPETKEEIGDTTIVSNRNIDVKTVSMDDLDSGESRSVGGLRVHKIAVPDSGTEPPSSPDGPSSPDSPSSRGSPSTAPDDTETAGPSSSGPSGPTSPSAPGGPASPSTDAPSVEPQSRGTFVLPDDKHFMQKLEARGKNGHGAIVETVYVLTGPSYTLPTDLIRLDNEEYYGTATRTSVSFNPQAMARKVASLYPDGEAPKLVVRFHTHPSGSLRPSSADKQSAGAVREAFVSAFGTDDFEFFHGIHGLEEHGRNPGPDERQSPMVEDDHVEWLGERYRHKLGLFGQGFETRKDVAIHRKT